MRCNFNLQSSSSSHCSRRTFWKKVETTPPGLGKIFRPIPSQQNAKPSDAFRQKTHSRFPSLNQELPNIPALAKDSSALPVPTSIFSQLPNGVKVTSEELYEQMSHIGVFVEAGTRYERPGKLGVSLLAEQAGFKGSTNISPSKFVQRIEALGANVITTHDRELLVFYVETLRDLIPQILELLAETVINPNYNMENFIENYLPVAQWELETLMEKKDQLINEVMHSAAFQGDPLGRSKFDMLQNVQNLTPDDIREHHAANFVGPQVTISAASVNHEKFIKYADQFFGRIPNRATTAPVGRYTGGLKKIQLQTPEYLQPGEEEADWLSVGFQCPGWIDTQEAIIICLLQKIMGGGQSFSAGGPGKGMYSRVYRNVLCGTDWILSAETQCYLYRDVGVISIAGSCKTGKLFEYQDKVFNEFQRLLLNPPAGDELLRAKNALKSSIYFNLEHRSLLCEDMGRQVTMYSKKYSSYESCDAIDSITTQDIVKVVMKFMSTTPTITVMSPNPGILNSMPDIDVYKQFTSSLVNLGLNNLS